MKEVGAEVPPVGPEEKTSAPEGEPEEKTSAPSGRKVRYEGQGGRIHTEAQIDELLDFYLMTGELPLYVSDRQRRSYKVHERLAERKEILEGRGIPLIIELPGSTGQPENVISISGTNVQRPSGNASAV